jgi:hypothetical protein
LPSNAGSLVKAIDSGVRVRQRALLLGSVGGAHVEPPSPVEPVSLPIPESPPPCPSLPVPVSIPPLLASAAVPSLPESEPERFDDVEPPQAARIPPQAIDPTHTSVSTARMFASLTGG